MNEVRFDGSVSSRELLRHLRSGCSAEPRWMPESVAWHVFVELRRRGEPEATPLFLATLKSLHSRRIIGATPLPVEEVAADEHRLVDDPFLADLWKAYKKCLRAQRNGSAFELLRDIEEQLCK